MALITRNIIFLICMALILCLMKSASGMTTQVLKCKYSTKQVVISLGNLIKTVDMRRNVDGISYEYHIENINRLSEIDDYLEIKDDRYSVTYPLKCKKNKTIE